MDEISFFVAETYRHFQQNFADLSSSEEVSGPVLERGDSLQDELPADPGVLYHIQKSTSVFVIRTLVSKNIREDFHKIMENPENYPSLRLIEGDENQAPEKLRFFIVENQYQAEIIHDQLNNRRFPVHEEHMCNLSDPGFSWWLSKAASSFQISFNLSVNDGEGVVKLGPLGDRELASRAFADLADLLNNAGLDLNLQNESNRIQFTEGEGLLTEELQDLFEFGLIGKGLTDLFKLLALREGRSASIESTWFYLQEIAAIRRFWIQIQYDLGASA